MGAQVTEKEAGSANTGDTIYTAPKGSFKEKRGITMNRIIALMIVLMIAMSAIAAWAAPGDAVLGRDAGGEYNVYYSGSFAVGDTLYLTNNDSISTWHLGDTEAVSYTVQYSLNEGEEDASWSCWPFAANDKLYALTLVTRYGENTEFLRAALCEVELTTEDDENVAKLTEKIPVSWEGMINYYDQDSNATEPQSCVGMGNLCCMLVYDDASNLQLKLLNVETGEITTAEGLSDLCAVVPYKDGKILAEQFNYNNSESVWFTAYDLKDGSCQQVARVKVDNSASLPGLAYDAAGDKLYCVKGGEIHSIDLEKGELGPAIADAPTEYVNDNGSCILNGGYYCNASYGAFVRNLDPSQRNETRIRVYDNSYNDAVQKAAATLPNTHGEIGVALDRDYNVGQRLVESMMNQDDSVDVYIMYSNDEKFNAVFNRGYMAELDGNEKLTDLTKRMYPAIQSAMSQNGHLVAIPVTCSASTFGVNEKALERLSLKLKDVPKNWSDMLDFIAGLSDRIKPETKVNLFYANQTFEEAKRTLFSQIFVDYQNYAEHSDPSLGYDTELLRGVLKKLDGIDFTKLGCKHEVTDGENEIEPEGDSIEDDSLSLFATYTGCSFGNFYSDYTPVLMSMDSVTPTQMVLNMCVAFINPYSKHPNEAMLFMEQLADCMSRDTLYCIDPSLNEPVRNSYYEEAMREFNESLKALKEEYESAEAADKQDLEAQIREQEASIADYEQTSWDISQTSIDWYRANDDNIVLEGVNWLYSENAGEASDLVEQYLAGQIDADAMLKAIDKKVNMMRLEGN